MYVLPSINIHNVLFSSILCIKTKIDEDLKEEEYCNSIQIFSPIQPMQNPEFR